VIEIGARLSELDALGLIRRTRLVSGPQGPRVVLDGKPTLVLCSDNCLGLADHPRVREAAAEAAMRWGVGAGASRLSTGTMTIHRRLEERLAAFTGRQAAVLFGSGFLANLGVIAALARPGDVVFTDECCHASIRDGCHLSGAETFVYDHLDLDHLDWGIRKAEGRGALIATEAVFATQGDLPPLQEIVELAQRRRIRTLVDESHSIGAVGRGGIGALAEAGVADQVDVVMASLGTWLGSYGAFVACDREMAGYLLGAARTLIFSTAPPPPAAAGALAALTLLEHRPRLPAKLQANATLLRGELLRQSFDLGASTSHIVPLFVGAPATAAQIRDQALEDGIFVEAILPPDVPGPAAHLRLSAMASHRAEELREAAAILAAAARTAGFDPQPAEVERLERPAAAPAIFDVEQSDRLAA
jgi:8-amino-7-oxononanoate synthase